MAVFHNIASGDFNDPLIWSLTQGGAGGAGVPGINDIVIFDTGAFSVSTSQIHSISQLQMLVGFTGTLDLTGFDFLTNLALILESGTLLLPASRKFECRGITNTIGGAIIPGSTGVLSFIGGTDSVNLLLANQSFYEIDINKSSPFTFASNIKCTHTLSLINNNTFANTGGSILFSGVNIFTSGNVNPSSTSFVKLELQGSNNVSITEDIPGRALPRIVMNKTGGVVTFPLNGVIDSDFGAWETDPLNAGIVDWNGCEYRVKSRGFFAMGNIEFDALTIDQIGNVTSDGNPIVVNKKLKLVKHNQLTGNYVCKGDIETSVSAESTSNATFDLQGTGTQTLASLIPGSILPGSLINNKTAGQFICNSFIKFKQEWTDLKTNSDYSNSHLLILAGLGSSPGADFSSNSKLNNITISASGNIVANFTCKDLTLNASNQLKGNIIVEGDFADNDATYQFGSTVIITLAGSSGQKISQGATAAFPNHTFFISKRRGTSRLDTNLNIADSDAGLPGMTLDEGSVLDLDSHNLTMEGNFTQNGFIDDSKGGVISVGLTRTDGVSSFQGNLKGDNINLFSRIAMKSSFRSRNVLERVF